VSAIRIDRAMASGATLALVVLLVPVFVVVLAGLNAGDYLTFPPQGLSLRWVIAFLQSPVYLHAYLVSFGVAAVSASLSTCLGTMAALALVRTRGWAASVGRSILLAPIVLPGIVTGLAIYIFYLASGIGLARTLPGLAIGHIILTCPFVVAIVTASLVGFDLSLEEAARNLGAGPLTTLRLITFRIIAPNISAAFIFAFAISFGQFDIALFLNVPNYETLPIAMYVSLRYEFAPIAAAAGIFAIVLVIVLTIVSARLVDLRNIIAAKSERG
jgi:putative spermidine/putrescine transport system permease protein